MCQTCTPETPASETKPISMGKVYKYRNGESAKVVMTDRPGKDYKHLPVVSMSDNGYLRCHTSDGKCTDVAAGARDLIEVGPYDDLKLGEPVMVRDSPNGRWKRYHFHSVGPDQRPRTIAYAHSAWVTEDRNDSPNYVSWGECRRPTAEELAAQGL